MEEKQSIDEIFGAAFGRMFGDGTPVTLGFQMIDKRDFEQKKADLVTTPNQQENDNDKVSESQNSTQI